jgi:hypothetical protein
MCKEDNKVRQMHDIEFHNTNGQRALAIKNQSIFRRKTGCSMRRNVSPCGQD